MKRKPDDLKGKSLNQLYEIAMKQAICRGFDHSPVVDEDITAAIKAEESKLEAKEATPSPSRPS